MDRGPQGCCLCVALPVLLHESRGLCVEGAVRIGLDEQTLDGEQDALDAVMGLPVVLEARDADVAVARDVGMEDGRGKPTLWRYGGEVNLGKIEGDAEKAASVRGAGRALDPAGEREHVGVAQRHAHPIGRRALQHR